MRSKTFGKILDHLMWFLIYMLPLIAYVVLCSQDGIGMIDFESFMSDFFGPVGNPIFDVFMQFADGGAFNIASYLGIIYYAVYMVLVTLLHVAFDIVVFIPRLFHDFLDKLHKGDIF